MRISDWSSDVCSSDLTIAIASNETAISPKNATFFMSTLPCNRFIRVFHAVESDSRRHVLASAPEFARLFHQTKHRLQGRYEIDRFPSRGRGLSPETRRQGRRPRRGRLATFASGSRCLFGRANV